MPWLGWNPDDAPEFLMFGTIFGTKQVRMGKNTNVNKQSNVIFWLRGRSQNTFTKICLFLTVYIFYGIKVYKKSTFLTTYPPPLVNVVCERPLNWRKYGAVSNSVSCMINSYNGIFYTNRKLLPWRKTKTVNICEKKL